MENAWGKMVCAGCVRGCGWKVLEGENVGAGLTGPMWRREAAKSGSRPSMSIAVLNQLARWSSELNCI